MLDLLFLVLMQTCNIVKLPFCLMSAINFFTAETWIHLPFGINLVTLISFVFANFCQPVFLFLNYCKSISNGGLPVELLKCYSGGSMLPHRI